MLCTAYSSRCFCCLFFFLLLSPAVIPDNIWASQGEEPLYTFQGWSGEADLVFSTVTENGVLSLRYNVEEKRIAVHTKTQTPDPEVKSLQGDLWLFTPDGNQRPLTRTPEVESNPVLSPDKQWVAFVRKNNLYTISLGNGEETQHTFDGSHQILNGYASWVYYEEILGRHSGYTAFWWSPDSRKLAFFRSDDSKVPVFPIPVSKKRFGGFRETRYPKAGENNPEIRIGILTPGTHQLIWTRLDPVTDQYFGKPFWAPSGKSLWIQQMNRGQDTLQLLSVDPENGYATPVYLETQSTWVEWKDTLVFLPGEQEFLLQEDSDGWDQICKYSIPDHTRTPLTRGRHWNTQILSVDPLSGRVYYTSRSTSYARNDLYCVGVDGTSPERLSFGNYHHEIALSPDHRFFFTRYSNLTESPRIAVCETHGSRRTDLTERFLPVSRPAEPYPKTERIEIHSQDGLMLPGLITWPVGFNPEKKYPVLISVYGGPGYQATIEKWQGENELLLARARRGWICLTVDHRGSGHLGKTGMNYLHQKLGYWELEDYVKWANFLKAYPFVNAEKIGMEGFSYGGYLTALALTRASAHFRFGIAGGSVTDWSLYDTHYAERYMDLPEDNPEGYRNASVLSHVQQYRNDRNRLRIEHGTADDNVHFQHSLLLIEALQKEGKSFEVMIYPGAEHGFLGKQRLHQQRESEAFLDGYL